MALGPIVRSATRTVTRGAIQNAPAIVQGLQTAAVGIAGAYAFSSAADLYGSRSAMANQFQQQSIFPSDLIQTGIRNFYMSFKFQEYEKRSIQNSPFLRSTGTIRLPLPGNLKDNMSINYANESLTPAVGAALEGAVNSGNIVGSNIGQTVSTFADAARNTIAGYGQGAAAEFAQSYGGQGYNAASAYFGVAVNPYQTVLFKNPEFKTHSFTWKLMPKNEAETVEVRNIIRTFQYHMSPGVSERIGLFFSYPSMVIVSLFPSSDFLYRFKPCVVKSVTVDYASGSAPSFFKRTKAAPTVITLGIQLQEIEYWTNKDFTTDQFNEQTSLDNSANDLITRQNRAAAAAGTTSVARNSGNPGGS